MRAALALAALLLAPPWSVRAEAEGRSDERIELDRDDNASPVQRVGSTELQGFSPTSAARQLAFEAELKAAISPERIEEHLRWLSSRPHLTGSEGTRLTVEYLHQRLREYGFDVETVRYEGYLPAPVSVSLQLLAPEALDLPTTEAVIAGDPFTAAVGEHPGWNGYSPSGTATGDVVYGRFGSEEDLRSLVDRGVDLEGKILLLRNFWVGEGRKVRNAERFGAAGVVLYTDPAEDGFPFGDVYPLGNWRPAESIMRRSILHLPYDGDPLSPGWASVPGAKRLTPEEVALPGIPVLPVSYATAATILSNLQGPAAPTDWQGALGLTYRLGPGPAKLHIETKMDNRDRPMLNVIGRIAGAVEPDQWVMLGNHHDAWIYGAGDPSSGTAAMLELARVIGEQVERGWQPRRSLVMAFWDAEEMMYGGSTEWVEEHGEVLLSRAVAYINMDSAVFNPDRPLSVSSHPALHELFREATHDIEDPRTGRPTDEVWREMQNEYRQVPGVDGWGEFFDSTRALERPRVFEVPYDDAAPFFGYLALPASDMYYGADYGMYHSIYENFHWMKSVVDPTFEYHAVMAQLQGLVALRLANADLLPLDFVAEAHHWSLAYEDLAAVAGGRGQMVPDFEAALDVLAEWSSEAISLAREMELFLQQGGGETVPVLTAINQLILEARADFHRPQGRPGAPMDRNLFAGSSYDFEAVSGSTLPGLRFALDRGEPETAVREAGIYLEAMNRRVATLRSIRAALGRLAAQR